jgi:polar amino acid transport system substrate-binding protein
MSLACSSTSTAQPTANPANAEPALLKLRLASSSWPPWVDMENQPRVALEIVSTALARAGYIAIHDIAPLGDLLRSLRSGGGAYDGSAALWRSEEREQFLLYSESYLENRMVLVGRRDSDVSAKWFSQLKGKKIGVVKDYAYGPELDGATEPVFVRGESTEANLHTLLHSGQLDYVLADALVVYHLKQQYPEKTRERLATGTTPLITRSLHFALRRNLPNAQQIIDRFNEQRAKMLKDGSYHTALQVDWILADVDGDGVAEMVAGGDKLGVEAPKSGYQPVGISKGGVVPGSESKARYVVKGVPYDTWDTVPDSFKTPPNTPTGTKPGTLRATVFEF